MGKLCSKFCLACQGHRLFTVPVTKNIGPCGIFYPVLGLPSNKRPWQGHRVSVGPPAEQSWRVELGLPLQPHSWGNESPKGPQEGFCPHVGSWPWDTIPEMEHEGFGLNHGFCRNSDSGLQTFKSLLHGEKKFIYKGFFK